MRKRIEWLWHSKWFFHLLMIGVYGIAIYLLTAQTPTVPAISDYALYVRMAQGDMTVPAPWNTRVLVPFLVSLLGGTEWAFHWLNLLLLLLACIILAATYNDYFAPLLFLFGVTVLRTSVGEAGIDAMIYLLVAIALMLSEREGGTALYLIKLLLPVFAALTHPMALVLIGMVYLFNKEPHLLLLGGTVFVLWLFPVTYGNLYWMDLKRLGGVIFYLSFLWIGGFTFKRDTTSLRDILIVICCIGFTFLASHAGRMIAPAGLVLAPRASKFIRRFMD